MKLTAVYLGSLLLLTALTGRAQSQDPGASPANTAKPDAAPAAGQTSTAAEKKKPKKVWTNDEIGSVKGSVSVVGDGNSSSEKGEDKKLATSTGGDEVRKKQIENYRNQIQQFQAQIDAADKRIAQLKNFKGENTSPSGGINPNQGYNMVPVEDQVKQLEDKKKELQGKIEDVENDARKNGIESGDLR
jgi:chromosome segregation ATPase